MQAVILAAGRGSRLEPVTHHVPKPLIPFWGRPFISYLLENLEGFVDEALIVDGPGGEVRDTLGDSYRSLSLDYTIQHEPHGTGHAVLQTRSRLEGERFIVMLADTCPPRRTIRELIESPGDAVLTAIEVDDPEHHGGVAMDAEGRVRELWTNHRTVDAGLMRLPRQIYDLLENVEPRKGEIRIIEGVNAMIQRGDDVRAIVMPGPWLQFGDHESLGGVLRVMRQIRNGDPVEPGASSVDAAACEGCEIHNSLVFGPGELVNCVVTDSMVYCGTRLENVRIEGEMAAFGPEDTPSVTQ